MWFGTYPFVHIGVLRGQGWDGDFIEEELSLVRTDGRVELVDGLTPVILLAQLLQNLSDRHHQTVTTLTRTNSRDPGRILYSVLPCGPQSQQVIFQNIMLNNPYLFIWFSGVFCYLCCRFDARSLQVHGSRVHGGQLHPRQQVVQLLLRLLVCLQTIGGATRAASTYSSDAGGVGQVAPPTKPPHPGSPYRYSHVNFYRRPKRQ